MAPIGKPIATSRKQKAEGDEYHQADAGDGKILTPEIGLRAFGHRAGNFLHPCCAGVRRHQTIHRVDAVDNGKQSADMIIRPKSMRESPVSRPQALSRGLLVALLARNCAAPQRGAYGFLAE